MQKGLPSQDKPKLQNFLDQLSLQMLLGSFQFLLFYAISVHTGLPAFQIHVPEILFLEVFFGFQSLSAHILSGQKLWEVNTHAYSLPKIISGSRYKHAPAPCPLDRMTQKDCFSISQNSLRKLNSNSSQWPLA